MNASSMLAFSTTATPSRLRQHSNALLSRISSEWQNDSAAVQRFGIACVTPAKLAAAITAASQIETHTCWPCDSADSACCRPQTLVAQFSPCNKRGRLILVDATTACSEPALSLSQQLVHMSPLESVQAVISGAAGQSLCLPACPFGRRQCHHRARTTPLLAAMRPFQATSARTAADARPCCASILLEGGPLARGVGHVPTEVLAAAPTA